MNKRKLSKTKRVISDEEKRLKHNMYERRYEYRKRHGIKLECKKIILSSEEKKKRHNELQRKSMYRKEYGITIKTYEHLLSKQNNSCAICGIEQKDLSRPLGVDHNHKTGIHRGLLCNHCNTLIGHAREGMNILNNAINYLRKYSENKLLL